MKFFLLLFLILATSCHQQKKVIKDNNTVDVKEYSTIKTNSELIVVLKNPNNVIDTKNLIVNSSLIWDQLIVNDSSLKVALIKVPIDKKQFWIARLKTANVFNSVETYSAETVKKIKDIAKNSLIQIRKTTCFGKCPVYSVIVFKDGKVTFNGIDNVLLKGEQKFKISKTKLKNIKEIFQKTSFSTYPDSFVNRAVMDYPSTFITYKNKQIEIKLWKKAPEEVLLAFKAVENILSEEKMID